MKDIKKALISLELKLRKGVLENEHFGDSYIVGIADDLLEIHQMIEPCTVDGADMSNNTVTLHFDIPGSVRGLSLASKASVILQRN